MTTNEIAQEKMPVKQELTVALERPLRIQEVVEQVKLVQQVMRDVMKDGEHYGVIPGCGDKPALLKPGAEKLSFTFRLAPEYQVTKSERENGHREYEVICTLRNVSGRSVGQGVGTCTTLENKYRYRGGVKESTGKAVPHEYWALRKSDPAAALELIGGKGFTVTKEDNIWQIAVQGEKQEHDNPADFYNTVLKMAKKRAHVDAVLTATATSDIFTQDVEEMRGGEENGGKTEKQVAGTEVTSTSSRVEMRDEEEPRSKVLEQVRAEMALRQAQDKQPEAKRFADWRDCIVHFTKNAGRKLGDLSNRQISWYYEEWMPRKKDDRKFPVTVKDQTLFDALEAWKKEVSSETQEEPTMSAEEWAALQKQKSVEASWDVSDDIPLGNS